MLTEKDQEEYKFYNILWVETRHGIMYRKAVGRIPTYAKRYGR